MADHTEGGKAQVFVEAIHRSQEISIGDAILKSLVTSSSTSNCLEDANIRSRLYEHLSSDFIHPKGIFCESIQHPLNPGLFVVDAEAIGLPLSHREANKVFDMCIDFEGPDDEVEEKVRTSFIIPWNAVEFKNPAFKTWLRDMTGDVIKDLRVLERAGPERLKVHFQGVVLQPPCASNESLKLTPKTENSFGMMAIVLPTAHTGGNIKFSSGETSIQFETAEASPFGCSIMAWLYTPTLQVDLEAIESGCRVMLVYDLFASEKVHFPSPDLTQDTLKAFYKTLEDFNKFPEASGDVPGVFAHFLHHTRELQTPILDTLDYRDRDIVDAVAKLCNENGILFYLANIQLQVTTRGLGNLGFDLSSEVDTIVPKSIRLNELFDLDGTQMAELLNIRPQNLLNYPPTAFHDWVNEKSEGGEVYMECHSVAIVFITPRCYPQFLLNPENEGRVDAKRWLDKLMKLVQNDSNEVAREQLRHGCRYITNQFVDWQDGSITASGSPFHDEDMRQVIKASLLTGELDLRFNIEDLPWESNFLIGTFIATYGFPAVEKSLSIGISKLPHVYSRRNVLNELETNVLAASPVEDPTTKELMTVWREKQAREALRDCVFETTDDARCLILMAGRYGTHFLLTSILDAIKKHIKSSAFVLEFMKHLAFLCQNQSLGKDAVRSSYRILLPEILPAIWLRGGIEKKNNRSRTMSSPTAPRSAIRKPRWKQIAELICNCLEFDLNKEVNTIVLQLLSEEASRKTAYCVSDFEQIYIPFLRYLYELIDDLQILKKKRLHVLRTIPIYEKNTSIQKLYRKLVQSCLKKLHTPDPPLPDNPTNWVKSKRGCKDSSCRDCRKLDRFLQDATRKRGEFKVHTQQRKHLEERFGGLIPSSKGYVANNAIDSEYRFKILDNPYPGLLVVEKTHQDFENQIAAWGKMCNVAINHLEEELVGRGAANLLGDSLDLMNDLKELVRVKLLLTKACVELCDKEGHWELSNR